MSLKKVYYGVFAEGKCLNDYSTIVLNILTSLIEIACREKMRRRLYSNHVTHFTGRAIRIKINLIGKKNKTVIKSSCVETLIARFRAFLYSDSIFQADLSSENKSPASAFIISRVLPEWC